MKDFGAVAALKGHGAAVLIVADGDRVNDNPARLEPCGRGFPASGVVLAVREDDHRAAAAMVAVVEGVEARFQGRAEVGAAGMNHAGAKRD